MPKLKNKKLKNYGYIYEPNNNPLDLVLGGDRQIATPKIIVPSGDWRPFLPAGEPQKKSFETNSCVSFATLNAIEAIEKRLYDESKNYSDRYLAVASKTSESGNTLSQVFETLRKVSGAIPEEKLPFNGQSWEEYMDPTKVNKKHWDEGRKWLKKYSFQHQWVNPTPHDLMVGLQRSPLVISVVAWIKDGEKYVKPSGYNDNHATLLVGCKEKEYWLIYDSYPDTVNDFGNDYLKKLDWNFGFGQAKSIDLERNPLKCYQRMLKKVGLFY